MTTETLSCQVIPQVFPEGTVDPGFTFVVTGTLADGTTPFSQSQTSTAPSASFDLPPGTFTGTVSKLGVTSQTSLPLVVAAPVTITLSVPDPAQAATFS